MIHLLQWRIFGRRSFIGRLVVSRCEEDTIEPKEVYDASANTATRSTKSIIASLYAGNGCWSTVVQNVVACCNVVGARLRRFKRSPWHANWVRES